MKAALPICAYTNPNRNFVPPGCSAIPTHVAMFDDRFPHQRTQGTQEFKPLEIIFRCGEHIHRALARRSLTYSSSQQIHYLITEEKIDKALGFVNSGDGILA